MSLVRHSERPARRPALGALAAGGALLLGTALATAAPAAATAPNAARTTAAAAAPTWAPADKATIHPGVQMYTNGAQCTANFVYTDDSGAVYVGYAAHCAGTGEATDTNGCEAGSLPLGTKVDFVEGGSLVGEGTRVGGGTLVYSSWLAMDAANETDANACAYNDLALVKVNAADLGKVNPSVPFWGGPTAVRNTPTAAGDRVYSFGNSSIRGGVEVLSPKTGLSLGTEAGWSHSVYTLTPGVPGDSGSGFLDDQGRAFGTLSTLALAPLPASNGVGDLQHELAYARSHSSLTGLTLVPGTEAFNKIL